MIAWLIQLDYKITFLSEVTCYEQYTEVLRSLRTKMDWRRVIKGMGKKSVLKNGKKNALLS